MRARYVVAASLAAVILTWAGLTLGTSKVPPKLIEGLDSFNRAVTTNVPAARRHFNQGMLLYYGFNHEEAVTSFENAIALDPGFAMAYWGKAIASGPNYNIPMMEDTAAREAYQAAQRARELAGTVDAVEQALIRAVAARYMWPQPPDRTQLDEAYANAMERAWLTFPDDPDVGALFAEARMNLRPWALWTQTGEPQPGTLEIHEVLESVLRVAPMHPGANHLMIHLWEASPTPGRAATAADKLRTLVPAIGHMLHMPSHIDIRLGRYDDVVAANLRAIEADARYQARAPGRGYYTMYRAHNEHFLAYAAMFQGRRDLANQAGQRVALLLTPETIRKLPDLLDGFRAIPYHVMVRFGQWAEILKEPAPPPDIKVTTAFWHYARTVAFSALGRTEEAAAEFAALKRAYQEVPASALIGNNTARVVLEIALPMAEGELEYRRANHDRAFELLREAVRRDDALRYDEPWGWMQPVRHALGALLVEQNRLAEAEEVYREDLRLHPGNGWALLGLAKAQRQSGNIRQAQTSEALFRTAWLRSDIVPKASCYCSTRL